MITKISSLFVFVLFVWEAQAQQDMDTVKIRPVMVTENIYMLKGSGGNIGVFIGKDGTLMIDDHSHRFRIKLTERSRLFLPMKLDF